MLNQKNRIWPLTGFPSPTLPCDEDALVLVLVPQRTVGLICQSIAVRKKSQRHEPSYHNLMPLSLHNTPIFKHFPGYFGRIQRCWDKISSEKQLLHAVYPNQQHAALLEIRLHLWSSHRTGVIQLYLATLAGLCLGSGFDSRPFPALFLNLTTTLMLLFKCKKAVTRQEASGFSCKLIVLTVSSSLSGFFFCYYKNI